MKYLASLAVGIFLGAVIYFISTVLSKKNYSKSLAEANEYLKGISDILYQKLVESTRKIEEDNKFSDYISFEQYVLEIGCFSCWKYLESEINKSNISKKAKKLFNTSDYTIEFVEKVIIKSSDIKDIIKNIWISKFEVRIKELEDEEDAVYGIDEDGNKVSLTGDDYIEDVSEEDMVSTNNFDSGIEPILEQKIIPPRDSEPEYIKEVTDEDEIIIDSKGRRRNKKNGRFI